MQQLPINSLMNGYPPSTSSNLVTSNESNKKTIIKRKGSAIIDSSHLLNNNLQRTSVKQNFVAINGVNQNLTSTNGNTSSSMVYQVKHCYFLFICFIIKLQNIFES